MFEKTLLLEFLRQSANPENVVVLDVGAHLGESAYPFAKLSCKVYCFEPERNNFSALKSHLSKFPNVHCYQIAVTDQESEKIYLYVSEIHSGIHSLKAFHSTHQQKQEVKCTRLDNFLKVNSIKNVDILKVDVEGADFSVLKGMDWKNYRPSLVLVEFMDSRTIDNYGYTFHDMVIFMKQLDYKCQIFEYQEFAEYGSEKHSNVPRFVDVYPYKEGASPYWGNLLFYPTDIDSEINELVSSFKRESVFRKIVRYPGNYFSFIPDPIKNVLKKIRANIKKSDEK